MHMSTTSVTTVNPATGESIAEHRLLSSADLATAVEHAHAAGTAWAARSLDERAGVIETLAGLLTERTDDLAGLVTAEMGKPITAARAEVAKCADAASYLATAAADVLAPSPRPADADGVRVEVRYQPLGAVLGIMPWNFPHWQSLRFALPALLAGNSVLIKPAPGTTGSGLALQDCCAAAGLGEVVHIVPAGNDEVAELIDHPLLRGVSLTGSTRAGRSVAELAGRALKPVVLELGGSDPYLVLGDADVEAAATTAATARMQNAGQSCIAAKRFLVVDEVYDAFLARFVEAVQALQVGDPAADSTDVGPLSSMTARETLIDQVERAVADGARIVSGGHPIPGPGAFYEPTVLTDVGDDNPCWREEVFGPVAPVRRVADVDEAVALANDSGYGLAASVWTRDATTAGEVAERLETGQVFVNAMVASNARFPFGGVKDSGFGRELGIEGFTAFANIKTCRFAGLDGALAG
jgi:succinate-semialdehyde dehydrogenase / glutarate-semialdehyde dehydrogenase